MRVLVLSQAIDEDDWLRAFMTHWVRQIAARVEQVDVVAQEVGQHSLPANVTVYTLGKERGYSQARMVARLWWLLLRLAPRNDVAFAHMNPRLAWLSAPLLKLFGKRLVLWYCHRSRHWELRWATAAAWRTISAVADSFPLPTPKLRVIGHGIKCGFFTPGPPLDPAPGDEPVVLHVARLMAIKHQDVLIRALAQCPRGRAVFLGAVPRGEPEGYPDELRQLAADLGLSERVEFAGSVLHDELREWYRRAAAAVNLSPPGLFDKAALEGLSCGLPTIISNAAFAPLMGDRSDLLLLDRPDDVEGLVARLRAVLDLPQEERAALSQQISAATAAAHDEVAQMDRLVRVLATGEP